MTCSVCPRICESLSLKASATMYITSDWSSFTTQYLQPTTTDVHQAPLRNNSHAPDTHTLTAEFKTTTNHLSSEFIRTQAIVNVSCFPDTDQIRLIWSGSRTKYRWSMLKRCTDMSSNVIKDFNWLIDWAVFYVPSNTV